MSYFNLGLSPTFAAGIKEQILWTRTLVSIVVIIVVQQP